MAKATVTCVCKVCGKTFTKSAIKNNRTEANSWEAWASEHFDLCPDCYAAKQNEGAEIVEMHYAEYKKNYADKKTVANSYNKETKTILVIIRTAAEVAAEKEEAEVKAAEEKKAAKKEENHKKAVEKAATATKSDIFKAAHRYAKKIAEKFQNYRKAFSEALKYVYHVTKLAKAELAK